MKFRKILLSIFAISLIVATYPSFAISASTDTQTNEKKQTVITLSDVTKRKPILFGAIKKARDYFVMDGPYLKLSKDINDIAFEVELSEEQVIQINELIESQHIKYDYSKFQPRVSVNFPYVCFTYGDLLDYFGVIGSVSVGAVTAVFSAVGSIYPGVGTIVGGIIGIWGGKEIVANIIAVMKNHNGIAFSIIPPEIVQFKGEHPGNG